MAFQHKENAKALFSTTKIGPYWNDFYAETRTALEYHFVQRLEAATEIVESIAAPESRILDLGCGAGVLSERLLESGLSVDAADLSPDMLRFTRERLQRFDPAKYNVFEADCEDLPIPDETYDIVACIGVFGYVDEVETALREVHRILRPGGTLVMSVRNEDNLNLFDVARLSRMVFRTLPSRVVRRLRRRSRPGATAPAATATARLAPKPFISIWDRPRDVIKLLRRFGFALTEFRGLGYGPLQFNGRPLLSDSSTITMSKAMSRLAAITHLDRYSRWIADVSVYVFKRDP